MDLTCVEVVIVKNKCLRIVVEHLLSIKIVNYLGTYISEWIDMEHLDLLSIEIVNCLRTYTSKWIVMKHLDLFVKYINCELFENT